MKSITDYQGVIMVPLRKLSGSMLHSHHLCFDSRRSCLRLPVCIGPYMSISPCIMNASSIVSDPW